jgi:hypothetical protein
VVQGNEVGGEEHAGTEDHRLLAHELQRAMLLPPRLLDRLFLAIAAGLQSHGSRFVLPTLTSASHELKRCPHTARCQATSAPSPTEGDLAKRINALPDGKARTALCILYQVGVY